MTQSDPVTSQTPPTPKLPPPIMHRYKLTIAYDGTDFHGWQKQEPRGKEPLRTVAGVLTDIIQRTIKQPILLKGSSRTDAGVHARGQVAHFDAATRLPVERMPLAFNSRLPPDVEVIKAELVPDDFDAIRDTTSKQYRYRLYNLSQRPLDKRAFVYHCWTELDLDLMNEAASKMLGTHDFLGFSANGGKRLTTVRTIYDCHVERDGDEVQVVVCGSGFLFNMVRIIAGTLVDVGREHLPPSIIETMIKTKDRRLGGQTLPPHGLWLEWIKYDGPKRTDLFSEPMPVRESAAESDSEPDDENE
jgi:tRNA pseudouridine38-40 synthase